VVVVREVAESEAVAKGMVVAVREAASMVVEAKVEAVTVTVVEVKAAAAVAAATAVVASVAVASVVVASAAAETVAVVREVAESEAVVKGMVVAVREAAATVVEATVMACLRSAAVRREPELHLGHSATHQHLQQMEADLAEALRHLAHRAAGLALACEAGCCRHWRAGARKAWQPEASAERRSCPGRLHCRL
jgi:hypothetical protein